MVFYHDHPNLFSFRLRISNSTSFSVTGSKKIYFRDLSSRLFEKLISLTGILVAKFGLTLIKYSLNLLLISYLSFWKWSGCSGFNLFLLVSTDILTYSYVH